MEKMPLEKMLLKPAEVADLIGVSRSRAYELISRGEVPSLRIGGSVRVPIAALRAWIEARMSEALTGKAAAGAR